MANNEGVDIIIKATDQYTKTINNITASNELFGKSVKNIEKEIAALQKYMISLKVNGMDTTSVGFKILQEKLQSLNTTLNQTKNAVNGVDNALAATGNNLKKNNQQWTNLSLVIQDLPYGFRGIQNNLPALLGGFAAVTGPIYLAFSAIIAVLTVMDDKMRQSASAAKKLKEEQANLNDEILQSTQSAREQGILLKSYIGIANDATLSDKTRNEALKKANELYGDHNQKLTLANINTKAVKESVDGYIQSLIQMAVAQKYSDQVANNIIKSDKIQAKLDEKNIIRQRLTAEVRGKQTNESRDLLDVYEDLRRVNKDISILESEQTKNVNELTTLTDKYSKSLELATELSAKFGQVEQKKGGKSAEKLQQEIDQKIAKAQDVQVSNFIDTLNERNKEIVESELKLQEDIATLNAAGFTNYESAFTANKIRVEAINKKYIDKDIEQIHKGQQLIKKINDDYNKDKIDGQVKFTEAYIKSLDAQLKAELRLNRNNVVLQQENIKNKITQLKFAQVFAAGNVKATEEINAALQKLNGTLTGVGTNWANTANKIVSIANDFLSNSFVSLGETIGQALAGEKVQPFVALAEILASSLMELGKALISFAVLEGIALTALKDPTKWPIALAAGIAAVAAGAFLKAKLGKDKTQKFANGGIISGPTMGLMGEYPGAASNPEVVAPLDKLKDLIGGGTGTLEARISGNDLLILMNKASRNNNNTF